MPTNTADLQPMRDTAVRLIRSMGAKAALEYCRSQKWHSLYDEVRSLWLGVDSHA